jgi:hypothetical protein
MTLILYLTCFGLGLFGMAFQIAVKLKSLQDKATAANIIFKESDFFKKDKWALIANVMGILLFVFIIGDVLKQWPALNGLMKMIFLFIGYAGSDVAIRFLGRVESQFNSIINIKTNAADGGSDNVTPLK